MITRTLDLDALGVEALDEHALATVNGGGWGDFFVNLFTSVVWDTIKEIYNSWDDFVDWFWKGYEEAMASGYGAT